MDKLINGTEWSTEITNQRFLTKAPVTFNGERTFFSINGGQAVGYLCRINKPWPISGQKFNFRWIIGLRKKAKTIKWKLWRTRISSRPWSRQRSSWWDTECTWPLKKKLIDFSDYENILEIQLIKRHYLGDGEGRPF